MKGILGKKVGMTQVFTTEGKLIPVTVVSVEPNVVTQIKTTEKEGYEVLKAIYGHFSLFLFRRSASSGVTASDSGKCIRTGIYAGSTYDRSIKTASGKGDICFFDRDYAGYVYSGSSRSD